MSLCPQSVEVTIRTDLVKEVVPINESQSEGLRGLGICLSKALAYRVLYYVS